MEPTDLSKRALEILRTLADNENNEDGEGELVVSDGQVYVGLKRISHQTVNQLLRAILVRQDYGGESDYRIYTINDAGKRFLEGLPPYRDGDGNYHATLSGLFKPRKRKFK